MNRSVDLWKLKFFQQSMKKLNLKVKQHFTIILYCVNRTDFLHILLEVGMGAIFDGVKGTAINFSHSCSEESLFLL